MKKLFLTLAVVSAVSACSSTEQRTSASIQSFAQQIKVTEFKQHDVVAIQGQSINRDLRRGGNTIKQRFGLRSSVYLPDTTQSTHQLFVQVTHNTEVKNAYQIFDSQGNKIATKPIDANKILGCINYQQPSFHKELPTQSQPTPTNDVHVTGRSSAAVCRFNNAFVLELSQQQLQRAKAEGLSYKMTTESKGKYTPIHLSSNYVTAFTDKLAETLASR